MEKASRAIRRSGVKLLSLPGGHGDLNMLVSEIKDIRHSAKLLMNAQHLASQDMMRWAANEENRAIQDVISQVAELNLLWTEVQKLFIENLKEYRHMFEQVLEGEKRVTEAKTNLNYCEEKEAKVKKELKRISKRATGSEMRIFETKVSVAEKAKEMAQLELSERLRENEAIKLIHMKSGMMKISEAYIDMSSKCNMLFSAQKEVVHQIPDVHRQELEAIRYTGTGTTRFIVQQARERIEKYNQADSQEPPPPYTPPESGSAVGKGFPQPAPRRSSGRESTSGPVSNLNVNDNNTTESTKDADVVHTHKVRIKMTDALHVDICKKSQCPPGPAECNDYQARDDNDDDDDGFHAADDDVGVHATGTSLYPTVHDDTTESSEKEKPVPVPRPRLSNSTDVSKDPPGAKTETENKLTVEKLTDDKVVLDSVIGFNTIENKQKDNEIKQERMDTKIESADEIKQENTDTRTETEDGVNKSDRAAEASKIEMINDSSKTESSDTTKESLAEGVIDKTAVNTDINETTDVPKESTDVP